MHYNKNADHEESQTTYREVKVQYPKVKKGEYSIGIVRRNPTYSKFQLIMTSIKDMFVIKIC